jgi:hypothetical protein
LKQYRCGAIAVQHHSEHFMVKKMNYMEVFLRTRSSMKHHIIFDDNGSATPLYSEICPSDLHEIFGPRLPDAIYYYLVQGLISSQVVNNFVSGVLIEGPPLCNGDTQEYRGFIKSLLPFRTNVINLLSKNLNPELANRNVSAYFWFEHDIEHVMSVQKYSKPDTLTKMIYSDVISTYKQNTCKEDIGFLACLSILKDEQLKSACGIKSQKLKGIEDIVMNAELCLLHDREFIDNDGNSLPYGLALSKCSTKYQNEMLVALELLRSKILNNKAPQYVEVAENTVDGKY